MELINGSIVYCATPFRMERQTKRICDFVEDHGHFPLHPFNAMPLDVYNYGRYDKRLIFKVCFGMVDISDELWIFGIGSGSLKEYQRAKDSMKPTRSFIRVFDPDWETVLVDKPRYRENFGDLVDEILERNESV